MNLLFILKLINYKFNVPLINKTFIALVLEIVSIDEIEIYIEIEIEK